MNILLAKSAGFCFGVDRAVKLAEEAAASGRPAVTLGPIIHNRHVVQHLEQLGVGEVASPGEIPDGYDVVIRSHGVSKAVYDALEARGVNVIDATCPFVKRIHTLVASAAEKGRKVVIIGTKTHPEVVAIAGWCQDPLIFETAEDLQNWLDSAPENRHLPLLMVCQTTSSQILWEKCRKNAKKVCTNCEIFDTICEATEKRQEEALTLSEKCDAMIIVGDSHSSNTGKLVSICRQNCSRVFPVDCAADLDTALVHSVKTVGVTAGDSTPLWIIK